MKTRTIFEAYEQADYYFGDASLSDIDRSKPLSWSEQNRIRHVEQLATFRAELLRRMDHYDWYEARQRFFDNADPLGYKNGENNAAMESARLEMNAAYKRFAAHPREQAKADKWRKENGI